jgi:hypothetical protein
VAPGGAHSTPSAVSGRQATLRVSVDAYSCWSFGRSACSLLDVGYETLRAARTSEKKPEPIDAILRRRTVEAPRPAWRVHHETDAAFGCRPARATNCCRQCPSEEVLTLELIQFVVPVRADLYTLYMNQLGPYRGEADILSPPSPCCDFSVPCRTSSPLVALASGAPLIRDRHKDRVSGGPRKSGPPDLRAFKCRSRVNPRSVSAAHRGSCPLRNRHHAGRAALRPGHDARTLPERNERRPAGLFPGVSSQPVEDLGKIIARPASGDLVADDVIDMNSFGANFQPSRGDVVIGSKVCCA